jgi:hypothetical protein
MENRLRVCMDALRVLADQPASELNRMPLAERLIDDYLRHKDASFERLMDAINAKGEDLFWITMREYVQSRLRRPDD